MSSSINESHVSSHHVDENRFSSSSVSPSSSSSSSSGKFVSEKISVDLGGNKNADVIIHFRSDLYKKISEK